MAIRKCRTVRESFKRRKRYLTVHPKDEKILREGLELIVHCDRIQAKPRMTRSDVWKKRPVVERWFAYKDLMAISYRQQGGVTFFKPVSIGYKFFLKDNRRIDLDNLIKGVNDALNKLAWPDDSVKYIKEYDYAKVIVDTDLAKEIVRVKIRLLK